MAKESKNISSDLILNYMREYATINTDEALNDVILMITKKVIEQHKYKIYYSESEGCWRTYLPDESKKSKRRPIKRRNREELEKAVAVFYLHQGKQAQKSSTLEKVFEQWLIYKRDSTPTKDKTIQEYMCEWNRFFKDTDLARMAINEIKPITIIRFFRKITKDRAYTHKRISNARAVLNGIMWYAVEEELILHNPVSDVDFKQFAYKPVDTQDTNVFSQEEAHRLLTYLSTVDEPYSLAIQLSFYLFIRVGETKGLCWEDINYSERTIYLHRQVVTTRKLNDDLSFADCQTQVLSDMKGHTSHGFRKQYLTDEAMEILEKAKRLNPTGKYIFEPDGRIMTTHSFNRRLKKYCKEAGIPYYSSHKIRFYNASTAYDGENLMAISRLMGHSQINTTLHYLRNVHRENSDIQTFSHLGLSGVQECSKTNG